MVFVVVYTGTGMKKGVHSEEGQEDFEDCATRIVLVERPDNGI